MITSYNPNNEAQFKLYSRWFKEAYEKLAENGNLNEQEIAQGGFNTLD
jgi:hypothetical protein